MSVTATRPRAEGERRLGPYAHAPRLPEGDEVDPLQQMSLEVRNNPRDIGLLIEELKKTTDPAQVAVLAELIARNADVDELPVKELFELARSENTAQRYAAMQILGKSERVSSEMLGMAEQMAKTDPNLAVRERCVTTMGEWMEKHGELSGKLCSTLIGVRDASEDAELRRYAIQTIKDSPAGVPAALVDALDASLRTETLAHNRSMAALALAYVEPSAAGVAVQKLQSAYMQEPNLDVKRHIITMIMRAGNVDAVNVLNKLPTPDPQLAQDVRDYAEIVQSGEQDIVKIIGLKLDRDLNRGTDTNGSPQ
jgi:hypothetical protein